MCAKHLNGTEYMTILFVNHSSKPAGAEFVLRDIVKLFPDSAVMLFEDGLFKTILEQQNTNIIMATSQKDMSNVKRDSNLFAVALPLIGSMISLVRQINNAARNYDVVYANSQKAFVLAAIASFINRKPLIWHCHDILSKEHFSKAQITLDIILANMCADRVFVPSKATGDAFVAVGGKSHLVRVLYNGVAPLNNEAESHTKQELRRDLGLPEGFLYGVFSRIAEWKGQHIAIEALKHLPEAKCLIVGDAQFGEKDYGDRLRQIAVTNGVNDRVIFLGHRSDVPTLMQAVDVYCHPSIAPEPFSLAILEAMRAGLPIAATNTGGIPEVIKPGVTGLLAEPGNSAAMSAILKDLMLNPQKASQLGNKAKELVLNDFTIVKMQKRAIDLTSRFVKESLNYASFYGENSP
jgi:glycosyltransferase involved in cell wall biosynthesis